MADGSFVLSGEPFPSQEPFPVRAKLERGQGWHNRGKAWIMFVLYLVFVTLKEDMNWEIRAVLLQSVKCCSNLCNACWNIDYDTDGWIHQMSVWKIIHSARQEIHYISYYKMCQQFKLTCLIVWVSFQLNFSLKKLKPAHCRWLTFFLEHISKQHSKP